MLPVIAVLAVLQAAPATSPPPGCTGSEHRALDFWVGEWDVVPSGAEQLVAHSRIESLHGGCAIREHWMPLNGAGGSSLSAYDPATGRWHQLWIGSSPGPVAFEGGPVGADMVMTGYWANYGGPGQTALVRQTFSAVDADTVRQLGEASADHGRTWTVSYDFTYRRRKEPLP